MVAGVAPSFTTRAQSSERKWVQIAMAMAAGALFVLFASSFLGDVDEEAAGSGPTEAYEDTRF